MSTPQPRLTALLVLAIAPNVLAYINTNTNTRGSGLSNGARIGIIVGIIVAFILLMLLSFLIRRRRIQRANRAYAVAANGGPGKVFHPPPQSIGGYRPADADAEAGQRQQEAPQMNQIRFPEPSHQTQTQSQQQTAPTGTFAPPSGPPPQEVTAPSRNPTLPPYTEEDRHV